MNETQLNTQKDTQLINLLFHNPEIADIFKELLNAMGYDTTLVESEDKVSVGSYLITEPIFYRAIDARSCKKCLVIGDGATLEDIKAEHTISRPLTPWKIEKGLKQFLSS